MKKCGYLCALLLCIPEFNQATDHLANNLYSAVGGGIIFGCIGYLYGKRNSELQMKQLEMQQAAIERERIDVQQRAETESSI